MWACAVHAQDNQRPLPQPGGAPYTPPPRVQELPPPADRQPPPRIEARPGVKWGALAYTADGAFGAAYGIETREDAERLAVDECRRESTDKADCARGVVARQDSWFHIQFCRRGGDYSTHVTTKTTLAETNQAAAQYANTSRYGAENCRMVPNGLFHSGGMHTKM